MSLEFAALAAALQTFVKPENLAVAMAGGIVGNRADALLVDAMKALRERTRSGDLKDVNHDVETASLAALRIAVGVLAEEVAARVEEKPPVLAAILRRRREGVNFRRYGAISFSA
jgi:hypothetical protein